MPRVAGEKRTVGLPREGEGPQAFGPGGGLASLGGREQGRQDAQGTSAASLVPPMDKSQDSQGLGVQLTLSTWYTVSNHGGSDGRSWFTS